MMYALKLLVVQYTTDCTVNSAFKVECPTFDPASNPFGTEEIDSTSDFKNLTYMMSWSQNNIKYKKRRFFIGLRLNLSFKSNRQLFDIMRLQLRQRFFNVFCCCMFYWITDIIRILTSGSITRCVIYVPARSADLLWFPTRGEVAFFIDFE